LSTLFLEDFIQNMLSLMLLYAYFKILNKFSHQISVFKLLLFYPLSLIMC